MPSPEVVAAGVVVTRKGDQVLLVHRPRYDDWSFPKGKLDRGEHITSCAVREVAEETGLRVRLGAPLPDQLYPVGSRTGSRTKRVHYWMGRVVGSDDVSRYEVNNEIDALQWVPWSKAKRRLSYDRDRETLAAAEPLRRKTRALVVLRHAQARSRKAWRGDDRLRPLLKSGGVQADRLIPILAAYDATYLVSSSSTRCLQTVAPYARATGWPVDARLGLSEEDATTESVVEAVDELLYAGEGGLLCSHRPVLPAIFDALGLPEVKLEPGGLVVVHHNGDTIVAAEAHGAR